MNASLVRRSVVGLGVGAALLVPALPSSAFPTEDVDVQVSSSTDGIPSVSVSSDGADSSGFYVTVARAGSSPAVVSNDPKLGLPGSFARGSSFPYTVTVYLVGGKLDLPDYVLDGYVATAVCTAPGACTTSPVVASAPDLLRGV